MLAQQAGNIGVAPGPFHFCGAHATFVSAMRERGRATEGQSLDMNPAQQSLVGTEIGSAHVAWAVRQG